MAVNVLMRFRKGHCDLGVRFMCEVCVMYPGSARQGDVIAVVVMWGRVYFVFTVGLTCVCSEGRVFFCCSCGGCPGFGVVVFVGVC
ncbi:hypothetical protein, partial [Corynebacterium sp. HMSC14H10]|uniref:hypothetical protein n=1 Tax=Corynebacterium sp. HMSC14H10 TaxID=1581103 RepID=UPI001AEFBA3C